MSYSYKPNENINVGTIRIVKSQIKATKRKLKARNFNALNIHNTRKYFKKIRALIRLNKDKLEKQQFKYENYYFRDLARNFASISDSDAAIETIDYLKKTYPEVETDGNYFAIREQLVLHSQVLTFDHKLPHKIKGVRNELSLSLKRIENWQLKDQHWSSIKQALFQSYLQGFNGFKLLDIESIDHYFHEWRKVVKLLRYEIALCQHLSKSWLKNKTGLFIELSSLLGKSQDLSVFCDFIQSDHFDSDSQKMLTIATTIKKQYHQKTLRLASRAYDKTPDQFLIALKKDLKPSLNN